MNAHSNIGQGTTNLAGDVIALMQDLLSWQDHIESAMRRVNYMYSFNDIVASIMRQERQFYQFEGCCVIMQLDTTPNWKSYHCFLACGSTEAILAAEPQITDVAKQLGCKYLSLSGRVGWPKRLRGTGWKHLISVMYKEVH